MLLFSSTTACVFLYSSKPFKYSSLFLLGCDLIKKLISGLFFIKMNNDDNDNDNDYDDDDNKILTFKVQDFPKKKSEENYDGNNNNNTYVFFDNINTNNFIKKCCYYT